MCFRPSRLTQALLSCSREPEQPATPAALALIDRLAKRIDDDAIPGG